MGAHGYPHDGRSYSDLASDELGRFTGRLLASKMVAGYGSEWACRVWAVIETDDRVRRGVQLKMRKDAGDIIVKAESCDMGPVEHDMPSELLELLTASDDTTFTAWRERALALQR